MNPPQTRQSPQSQSVFSLSLCTFVFFVCVLSLESKGNLDFVGSTRDSVHWHGIVYVHLGSEFFLGFADSTPSFWAESFLGFADSTPLIGPESFLGFAHSTLFLRLECVLGFFEGSLSFAPKGGLDFANSAPFSRLQFFLGFADSSPFFGPQSFLGFFHGTSCFAPKGDLDHIVLPSYNLSTPRLGSLTGSFLDV